MSHAPAEDRRGAPPFSALVLLGFLAALTAGCATGADDSVTSAAADVPATQVALRGGQWVLAAGGSVESSGDAQVTLRVDGRRVSGSAGCNSYNGPIRVDGNRVAIGKLATTLRACDDAVMRVEDEFLRALEAVDRVEVSDERLVLGNDRGVRLVFDRFDAREHVVGEWSIVNVNTGDAIVSVVPGTDPTVTFADDGTLQVETGCNTGAGTWTLRGDEMTFGPLALTRRACIEPDGIDEQETAITQALQGTRTVQVAPDQLTLLHPRGTIALVASR